MHGDDDAPAGGTRLPPSPPPSPGLPGTLDGQPQLCSALGRWELHITKRNLAWYLVQRAVRLQKVTTASHTAATTHGGESSSHETRRSCRWCCIAGNWSEQLLKSMYQVTWHHASAFPLETGQLWLTVAANKRNVIPILDFVITQGLQEAAELPDEVRNRSLLMSLRSVCSANTV